MSDDDEPEPTSTKKSTIKSTRIGNVGFGFVIKAEPKNIIQWGNLGPDASVYQGEVFAVHKAAEWLLGDDRLFPVHFFIDSQATIESLESVEITSQTVLNCRLILERLEENGPVILHWVKAHVGHELNEEADRAAKFGTFSRWVYQVPIADSIVKSKLREESRLEWAKRWHQEPTCRQTRLILPDPNPRMAKFLFKLSRHYMSMMVHFISGHNHLRYCLLYTSPSPRDS